MKILLIYVSLLCSLLSANNVLCRVPKSGYPNRYSNKNVLKEFKTPPKGYGEVSFFWWYGDSLTRQQLSAKLDMLKDRKVSSLQVNYCHSDEGGNAWGLTAKSKPELFTDQWWELFGWFMGEAKKRDMTVSLSDYTLGVGQGFALDEVLKEHPDIMGYELQFVKKEFSGKLSWELPDKPLSLVAYKLSSDSAIEYGSQVELIDKVSDRNVTWSAPNGKWVVACVFKKQKTPSYDPMHPLSGKLYVEKFFQKFEDKFPEESKGGLNFFFSDELEFMLRGFLWNDIFLEEFRRRKKYDVIPYLAGLFMDIGDLTPKIRLDYNDVMTALSEENFFKPVYDWHNDRQLIFGCDHGGRGRDVAEFGDYFRTQRWNQGPGSDQPRLGKDIIKAKVASSIANMYERPRVWLEGFYSSGWGTNTADLADAIFANYAMGFNLLSLHGLYYNTMGGWWEWAPPCNHFHMPYWKHMQSLLECSERLSYLLAQGHHVSDVAILYPVEPVVAGHGIGSPQAAFALGEKLYSNGIDFDYMDYESLHRAKVKNGKLDVSGMSFRVLVLPSMKSIKYASLVKALEFKKAGGIVICLGDVPCESDRSGRNDLKVDELVKQIFVDGKSEVYGNEIEVYEYIKRAITPDFQIVSSTSDKDAPYVMHRKVGERNIYAVYNVSKGSECFFRTKGAPELWDPWTGNTKPMTAIRVTEEGTYVSMPLDKSEMQIVVFDPSLPVSIEKVAEQKQNTVISLGDEWECELKPILDNRWGDFHWPATDELIGAEVRKLYYCESNSMEKIMSPGHDSMWKKQSLGYGLKFMMLEALPRPLDESELIANMSAYPWAPYEFSWRWGVEGDPGRQGYHGLKAKMYDDFIRLGALAEERQSLARVKDQRGGNYYLYTYLYADCAGEYDVDMGSAEPASVYLNGDKISCERGGKIKLNKGANQLLLYYKGATTTYFVVKNVAGKIVEQTLAERPLSMKWNGDMSIIPMGVGNEYPISGWYKFMSAPGLETLSFQAYADNVQVWAAGQMCEVVKGDIRDDGLTTYVVNVKNPNPATEQVLIRIESLKPGFTGGAAIPNPIKESCGKGRIKLGDWSKIEGLESYSGGVWYSKKIVIDQNMIKNKIVIDLGSVVSSVELWVNGSDSGRRLTPPWSFDISEFVKVGENEIRILVYNTAANHYTSIPTNFRGSIKSGLIGPVNIHY